jgi:hypothetical protein
MRHASFYGPRSDILFAEGDIKKKRPERKPRSAKFFLIGQTGLADAEPTRQASLSIWNWHNN